MSNWWPWMGELARRAYLLTQPAPLGLHAFVPHDGPAGSWLCDRCFQPAFARDRLCREFLVAIPATTSEPHDPPPPPGRLL